MSVNVPEQGNAAPSSMLPPSTAQTQTQTTRQTMQPQQQYTGAPQPSVMQERNPAPMTATADAEAMKSFNEAIKALTATGLNEAYDLQVLSVSKNELTDLFVSAIVLVVRHKQAPEAALAYHTMLVADTAGTIPNVQVNINGRTVEQQLVVGDAYDNDYRAAVAGVVARNFPRTKPTNMYDAEGEVIPSGYDYKNMDLVRKSLSNAMRAASTVLNSNASNFKDYSLEGNANGINSTATLMFNQPQQENSVGEPIRTDVYISYAEIRGQQRQVKPGERISLNSGERSEQLFGIGGFMDLLWDPANPQAQANPFAPQFAPQFAQQPQVAHLYTPRFIITKLDAKILNTLPGQLLGLVTALTLRDNGNWIGAFRRPHTAEFDMADIGAIGIEANIDKNPSGFGSRIDTRSESFTAQHLAMLIQTYVRPNMAISMDIDECGPETWLTSAWLAAARGSQDATNAILAAASLLTNGRFSYNGPVAFYENNRIHRGYYHDKKGVRRDIRDVNHLAILNLFGEQDPQLIRDWSDTFTRVEYSTELRLAERRRILELAVGGQITYTGFAERVTISGAFLDALAKAVVATGLNIRPVTPYQDLSTPNRSTAAWMQNLRLGSENSGLFNRTYGGVMQTGMTTGASFGRWGA